jgi:hypothetical protein
MRTIRMLGRLLWKEAREGWLVVAIVALVPPAAFAVAKMLQPDQKAMLQFVGAICSPAAIMLWAALKGERLRNEGKLPLAHLSVNPILERMVSLGLPILISALAGAWLAALCRKHGIYHVTSTDAFTVAGLFALYGVFAFAACCLLSAAVSTWTGIAAGLGWLVVGMFCLSNFPGGVPGFRRDMTGVSLASVVSLALFLGLSHKRRFRFAWAPPIALLAIAVLAPVVCDQLKPSALRQASYGATVMSRDGAYAAGQPSFARGRSTIFYTNKRAGTQSLKCFDGLATPVALDDRGGVFLLQSLDNRRLRVLEWDGKRDGRQTRQIADIPGSRTLLDRSGRYWAPFGSVSPDRRYLLFTTGSLLGGGTDCWIVNLRLGQAWIAIPNQRGGISQVTWLGDRVALSPRWSRLRMVDLRTRSTHAMRIPTGTEGRAR